MRWPIAMSVVLFAVGCSPERLEVLETPLDPNGVPLDWPGGEVREVRLDAVDGVARLPWTLQEGVHSLSLGIRTPEPRWVALTYAEDPSGQVWVDADLSTGSDGLDEALAPLAGLWASPNPTPALRSAGRARLPNTPDLEWRPGDWVLEFQARDMGSLELVDTPMEIVLVERTAEPTGPQQLDLNLILTGAQGFRAGEDHPIVDRIVANARRILRRADIHIGWVHEQDVPVDVWPIDRGVDCHGSDVMDALVDRISHTPPATLNVVLVDGVVCGSVPRAVGGWSQMGVPLDPRSAVYLDVGILSEDVQAQLDDPLGPRDLGTILAHEIGHALGLSHTSELSGALHDNLQDTPEGEGGDNLMLPTDSGRRLTPDQRFVIERSPYLRPMD